MLKLHVVIGSTRPGRAGLPIGQWFHKVAQGTAARTFETELVDLAEFNLPLIDEPEHPRLRKYQHEHTKRWSASVESADAFVFVTPEYNFSAPPALINAFDYLFAEWQYKPAAFVNYGGISGGTRSVQMVKQVLTALKVMPIPESVTIPFSKQYMGPGGEFQGNEAHEKAAAELLRELGRWAAALKALRA